MHVERLVRRPLERPAAVADDLDGVGLFFEHAPYGAGQAEVVFSKQDSHAVTSIGDRMLRHMRILLER